MSRNLFDEISEGFDALKDEREGKLTLKKHPVDLDEMTVPDITSEEIIQIREDLKLSQALFAHYLRINKRTLENWEQGRARPNSQAAVLIKMVKDYPDTIDRLRNV